MENILDIKNLNKSYKDFSLKNVNFSLRPGYIKVRNFNCELSFKSWNLIYGDTALNKYKVT
jgi:hypothetical protein